MAETTTTIKISRGAFQHVEAELYAYQDTIKEISRLRDEILYASPEPNRVGGGKSNLPSDMTALTATRLVTDKRLTSLNEVAEAIKDVYDGLPPDKQKLVRLRYWTKPQLLTWDGVAMELHVSRRQAMRWRDEIVLAIALRLGWR